MKILITTYWYSPAVNGVVTSVLNLKRALWNRGHEVRILTLADSYHSSREGDIYRLGSAGMGLLYPNARLPLEPGGAFLNELLRWKPNIIHSQCEFFTFPFSRRIAAQLNVPLIHTWHTVYEDYTHYFSPSKVLGKKAVAAFSRKTMEKTDLVIAPTDKVKQMLTGYGVRQPIHTVPSGIDLSGFSRRISPKAVAAQRQALGLPEDCFLLVSVGRMAKEKNLEEIIGSLRRLPEDVRLLLVGDGPHRNKLKQYATACGVADNVVFTGMIPPQEVAAYYQLGDLFVSASNSETQGLTYIEALASGLPAVCRQDPCLDGVIRQGENGYQYETIDEYCRLVTQLRLDRALRNRLAAAAAAHAGNWSVEGFAENVEMVYLNAVRAKYGLSAAGTSVYIERTDTHETRVYPAGCGKCSKAVGY